MLSRLQNYLPQHFISTFAGWLANCEIPWLKNRLIQYFLWRYTVNLAEALQPDPYQYRSFNDFFTRTLKTSARPIAAEINALACPADGQISQLGHIKQNQILQVKNHHFSLQDLLGGDTKEAVHFMDGSFLTVYLAPANYHRVHMPIDGRLVKMIYIPGRLFSVNFKTTIHTSNLFARNERIISFFDTAIGKVAVILVGAMIVGSMETVWAGTITPPRGKSIQTWNYIEPGLLKKGEEVGRFKLGSTAILLFERDRITWDPEFITTHPVQMGQRLGIIKPYQ